MSDEGFVWFWNIVNDEEEDSEEEDECAFGKCIRCGSNLEWDRDKRKRVC